MRAGLPTSVQARLDPEARYGLRLTLLAVAVVLVTIPFATLLFQVLGKGPLVRADGRLANRLNAQVQGHPGFVATMDAVSWLGRPPLLAALVVIAAAIVWWRGRHRLAVFLAATSLGGGIVDTLVKAAVNRPRPVVDHPVATALGKSFPSGHAMSSTVTYGALLVALLPALPRRWRPVAVAGTVLLVLAIGCSRLVLGVHFLSDVLGGWVLGLAWLVGAIAVFQVWRTDEGRRPADPLTEGVEPEAGAALGQP